MTDFSTNPQTRRHFLKTVLTTHLIMGTGCGIAKKKQEKPNVIIILTDDQGYGDLGYNGNKHIKTPNLDLLARQSIELEQFYNSPVCAPTRACLLTGRYHYRTGVIHTSRGGAKMHSDEMTLAEILHKEGYKTGILGKWHLGDNFPMRPSDQGFEESLVHKSGGLCQTPDLPNHYYDPKLWHNNKPVQLRGYCTDIFTRAAIRFIERNRKDPFFIYLAYNAPHDPLIINDEYIEPYRAMGLDEDTARVYGMMSNIDENIGQFNQKLDQLDLTQNTLFVFMSDNGPAGSKRYNAGLKAKKGSTYEGGIRVPCFIRWPDKFKPKRKIDRIAAHIDIMPTILEALDISKPKNIQLDGKSLMPLLTGTSNTWPDRFLFFQFNRGMIPKRYQNCCVRSQKYKLVSGYHSSKERASDLPPVFELYDMQSDPGETHNVALQYPDVVKTLLAAYENWYDNMAKSRNFEPGVIHIGSPHENPVHLCRYQDQSYIDGKPQGWPVVVEKTGLYEISINRCGYKDEADLWLKFNDLLVKKHLYPGVNKAEFELPEGSGMLDIWFQLKNQKRILFTGNHTIGDVDIYFLERSEDKSL
jgi:arylsulfatase A-like enzyme